MDGELHVGPAGLHSDSAQAGERRVTHRLIFDVGKGLGGGHGDRVAGVDPHRIDVLDRADDHAVVGPVPHDLEFELLPTGDGPFDEDLGDGTGLKAGGRHPFELLVGGGDTRTPAAQDVGRSDYRRQPDRPDDLQGLLHGPGDSGGGNL